MKNKGFTLVELLAVVAVLILLITVITPKVINQLSTSEEVTRQEQINTLIDIAKIYTNENTDKLPEEDKAPISLITIEELKQAGLINKSQIIDPKTKEQMTGCIRITIENNNYKYTYNNNCNKTVLVTFDAQGGSLNQNTKTVIVSEKYGELPNPTRKGYDLKGWNGKNLFDIDSSTGFTSETLDWTQEKTDTGFTIDATNISGTSRAIRLYLGEFPSGTYTINSINSIEPSKYILRVVGDNSTPDSLIKTITINETSNLELYMLVSKNTYSISNIQLEEGTTSTTYEPYCITSNTTVVQENDHTLKAIWEGI